MDSLKELIDAGVQRHGSVTALAKAVGVHPNAISGYRGNTKPCGLEMHVKIALAAGYSEPNVRDYLWELVKQRLGKMVELAAVAGLLFIGFTGTGFVQPAAAAGPDWGPKSDNV